jgi:class 3 adenylate cyclase
MGLEHFRRLIAQRAEAVDENQRQELDERIWERFGALRTVMVTDIARFSRITRDHGIVHFLTMIHRTQTACTPVLERAGGRLVKAVADNLYVTFDAPQQAFDAGMAMAEAVRADGRGRPDAEQVWLAIGIAQGRILEIDGEDFYGDAVNLASKLGEDTATGGEILVTADAAAGLDVPPGFRLETRHTRVSALELEYRALVSA